MELNLSVFPNSKGCETFEFLFHLSNECVEVHRKRTKARSGYFRKELLRVQRNGAQSTGSVFNGFLWNRPSALTVYQPRQADIPDSFETAFSSMSKWLPCAQDDLLIHLFYSPHHLYLPLALRTLSLLLHPAGRYITWMIVVRWMPHNASSSCCTLLAKHLIQFAAV